MGGGFYKSMMLDDEHFQKIEKILKVELTDENKEALQQACNTYFISRKTPVPRLSKTKEQLYAIHKHCELLLRAFQKVDDVTASYLSMYHPKTITGISGFSKLEPKEREIRRLFNTNLVKKMDELLEQLPGNLQIIEGAATKALKELKPDKGGRTPEMALDILVQNLQLIYEEVTRKKANIGWNNYDSCSGGDFLNFFEAFLAVIGCYKAKAHNREALASTIKRTLKRRTLKKRSP